MQRNVIDVVTTPKRFRNHQAFVLGPFKCGFPRSFLRLHDRFRQKVLNVLA